MIMADLGFIFYQLFICTISCPRFGLSCSVFNFKTCLKFSMIYHIYVVKMGQGNTSHMLVYLLERSLGPFRSVQDKLKRFRSSADCLHNFTPSQSGQTIKTRRKSARVLHYSQLSLILSAQMSCTVKSRCQHRCRELSFEIAQN